MTRTDWDADIQERMWCAFCGMVYEPDILLFWAVCRHLDTAHAGFQSVKDRLN